MSAIHLKSLVKRFGPFTALKTMDMEIADGEFMALLGPSGCGKSTTMNMIAGMEAPTEGRILFGDRDVTQVPMGQRGVGFVFQNYAIFTHMSVRQNLDYGLRMKGVDPGPKTAAMAELLGLTDLLDRPSAGLSVNILQRLAIGRSAIMEPAIFLLDEPLSNVDAAFRAVMRTELKALQRQFRQTMVYVTHDQLEAMTMADRIAVMDHGVLQQVGTPLEIYDRPANTFVASFIGSPAMNLIPGEIRGGAFTAPGVEIPGFAAADGPVTLGFRAEDAQVAASGEIQAPVYSMELLGDSSMATLQLGSKSFAAIKAAKDFKVEIGENLAVRAPARICHLFDAQTGQRLSGAKP